MLFGSSLSGKGSHCPNLKPFKPGMILWDRSGDCSLQVHCNTLSTPRPEKSTKVKAGRLFQMNHSARGSKGSGLTEQQQADSSSYVLRVH